MRQRFDQHIDVKDVKTATELINNAEELIGNQHW